MEQSDARQAFKRSVIDELHSVLASPEYKARLATIHRHYYNLKSESRYRDALLEVFNEAQNAKESCAHKLIAFAEADKVDMVVTRHEGGRHDWVRIELKYHFTYDFAHRVRNRLGVVAAGAEEPSGRGDLAAIVEDCRKVKGVGKQACDLFILIIQDRSGATHDKAGAGNTGPQAGPRWRCPYLDIREVPLQFLNEQISLDRRYSENQRQKGDHAKAWKEPLIGMLQLIYAIRPFRLLEPIRHEICAAPAPVPLTSHLIALDFSMESGLLDESALVQFARGVS